ncbi:MAG: cytochrome C oxidase subunit IV family protein [Oceanicaulis sp.]
MLTVANAEFDLGWINIAANLLIAFIKAALVVWVFMESSEVGDAIRLFTLGVLAWIALMFVFTSADYFFREGMIRPGQRRFDCGKANKTRQSL